MEMSGHHHAPSAFTSGKNLCTHLIGLVGPKISLDVLKRKICCFYRGLNLVSFSL